MEFYAHSHPEHAEDPTKWQTLEGHLRQTAEMAREFAAEFRSSEWAWNAAWLHDVGKAADEFQAYLARESGLDDTDYDTDGSRVNHSSAGAALAEEQFSKPRFPLGRPLSYVVAGHHAGLPDYFETDTGRAALRMRLDEGYRNLERVRATATDLAHNLRAIPALPPSVKKEQYHLWVRMLFSCLTDADALDTEAFMHPEMARLRGPFPSLADLKARMDDYLAALAKQSEDTPVNAARRDVLAACRAAAATPPGLFSLTVPTGGGKTLSGMAFALDHAVLHGKRRVIYVIPYTSIIEQTGSTLAGVLGRENVVEHHSNLDPDKETQRSRLACDNWDAPVVITTNVQFFESLYSARPGRCRKLHNIVNSVVILDEAQMLPPELLTPCVDVMNQLVCHYGTTLVLATATQPALPGLCPAREIVPNPTGLYARLKRTTYILPPTRVATTWEALAAGLSAYDQVLCVVNSRKDCHDLFRLMPEGTLHLSALMCGEHRSRVIAAVKQRLKDGMPTRVVSTQLVEAGVDMDFPVVYRAWAGLDSIAQAAGRCNREGKLERLGKVHIFVPPKPSRPGLLRKGEDTARELLDLPGFNLEQPDAFSRYFAHLYGRVNDKGKEILADLTPDSGNLAVKFRTVGARFRLIKDGEQRPLFVHYDTVADELIERLRLAGPSRDLLRRLQRYTVSLSAWQFDRHRADTVEVMPGFWVWNGRYRPDCGMDVFGNGLSPEESVI